MWPGGDDDGGDDDDDDVLQLLASLSYGLNYVFLRSLSWRLLYLELVNDVCGTYVSYYIAEYSFITDISPVEQRLAAQLWPCYCTGVTVLVLPGPTASPWWTGWTT